MNLVMSVCLTFDLGGICDMLLALLDGGANDLVLKFSHHSLKTCNSGNMTCFATK